MDPIARSYPHPTAEVAAPRRPAESPAALAELADASRTYAEAAAQYVSARETLEAARSRWAHLRDAVAKTTEVDGV